MLSANNISQIVQSIYSVISVFIGFALSTSFNGYFKARVAHWLGDSTPKDQGFLSLDPSSHVDLVTLLTTLLILIGASILIPGPFAVPIAIGVIIFIGGRRFYPLMLNSHNFRFPRLGTFATHLAGPIGSFCAGAFLLLGVLFTMFLCHPASYIIPIPLLVQISQVSGRIFAFMATYAFYWGFFDLLPVFPNSAGRAILALIPDEYENIKHWYVQLSFPLLLLIFIIPMAREAVLMPLLVASSVMKTFVVIFYEGIYQAVINLI
jgi:hypothetical protein